VHPVFIHIGVILIPAYGALAALGVVAGLFLAHRTARIAGVNPGQVWNLCIVALFAALVSQRVLLVAMNWSDLRLHPSWMLALAMVHHPLLAAAGTLTGIVAAAIYVRRKHLPLASTADALAAPLALGLVFEQVGALMAGSGYGTDTTVRWAVTYTSVLAARWSGTPLGIPLHPVQAYAALAYLTLAVFLLVWLPGRKQAGDVAGVGMMGIGVTIFITELWRDSEGRGVVLGGALDGPQIAGIVLVLAGGLVLMERKRLSGFLPFREPSLRSAQAPVSRIGEDRSKV
jgi:phosphatidylglycerol---prolipoprotein diacylglyceryl transferase